MPNSALQIHYTNFNSVYDNVVKPAVAPWEELAARLASGHPVVVGEKLTFPSFSAWRYKSIDDPTVDHGTDNDGEPLDVFSETHVRRLKSNALEMSMLIIDFDGRLSIEDAQHRFGSYEHVGYTSLSHHLEDEDRFRIVIPFTDPMPKAEFLRLESGMRHWIDGSGHNLADNKTYSVGQVFLLPAVYAENAELARAWHNRGRLLDWRMFESLCEQTEPLVTGTGHAGEKRANTANGFRLLPDDVLQTKTGAITVRDINQKISHVYCPFHGDTKPSEFVAVSKYGNPYLVCKRCGTIPLRSSGEDPIVAGLRKIAERKRQRNTDDGTMLAQLTLPELDMPIPVLKPVELGLSEIKSVSRFDLFKTSERYLNIAFNVGQASIEGADVVFIKSTKGTGKTEVLSEIVEKLPNESSVIQIGHRRSLSLQLAERLTLTSYLLTDGIKKRFSMSVDSLARVDPNEVAVRPYDVVIIDESEQVFRHLVGDTMEKKRGQIFSTLVWLIQNAKLVICSDADLTFELTVYVMSKLRRNFEQQDHVTAIVNDWCVGRSIDVYENRDHAIANMVLDVIAGKRVYVPVERERLACQLETLLKYVRRPDDIPVRTLTLIGANSDTPEAKAFFTNPNLEAVKYDVIIATSTLSTGVSIDVEWFDAVYGLFDSSVYTYQDCDQAISRVRSCKSVNVYVHPEMRPTYETEAAIRTAVEKKELTTRRWVMPGESVELSAAENLYLDVASRIHWCVQAWKRDRINAFVALKEADGWFVNRVESDGEMASFGKELRKIGRDPRGESKYRPQLNAENLSEEEFESLRHAKGLLSAKKHAVSKYRVARTFGVQPADVTAVHMKQYYEDGASDVVRNMRLLAASRDDAKRKDVHERENPNGKAVTDFDHRVLRRSLMIGALKASGIDIAEVYRRIDYQQELAHDLAEAKSTQKRDSRPYRDATSRFKEETRANVMEVTLEQLAHVSSYVRAHMEKMNLYLKTHFNPNVFDENRLVVFNKVLGEFGIFVKRERKKGAPRFIVDYDKVSELSKSPQVRAAVEEIGQA
ncbi:Signal recognition particle GTPase [Burkholderia pseudomallei]|nr:Signal recognition particle GTPase [Burkholderia pseudomallei]CAJ5052001.1 Signal recognition particle GTPase [Burkholderia pseudomallei]